MVEGANGMPADAGAKMPASADAAAVAKAPASADAVAGVQASASLESTAGAETAASAEADTPTSRLEIVFGREGVRRLARSTVLVFGVGGVGSNCVEALARGGVGHLVVVDGDAVQPSNINRQAIAFRSTVGMRKVEAVRRLVADVNPEAEVVALDRFVLPADVEEIMDEWAPRVDFVIDAIDTVASKLAIAAYADRHGVPLVSSMGAANKLRPDRFQFADVFETSNDPLCRVMRKECRRRGIRALQVLYSTEEALKVLPGALLDVSVAADAPGNGDGASVASDGSKPGGEACATLLSRGPEGRSFAHDGQEAECAGGRRRVRPTLGTASYVPPIMGQMIAGYVIRRLVGIED